MVNQGDWNLGSRVSPEEEPGRGTTDWRTSFAPRWHLALHLPGVDFGFIWMETTAPLENPSESATKYEEQLQELDRYRIESPAFSCLSPLVSRLILLRPSLKANYKPNSCFYFSENKRLNWEKLTKDQLSKAPKEDYFSVEDAHEVDRIWFYAARISQNIALEAESTLRGYSVAQIQELFPKALSMSFAPVR